jgi:glycosyltransferase involved in cell wall biosynthesis
MPQTAPAPGKASAAEGKASSGVDPRPGIAIISNSHTPYRLHLHQRIAKEVPEIKLWSVYTHETSNAPWTFDGAQDDIGAVMFGKGENCDQQADPRRSLREWRRGGRIIRWMKQQRVRFVLMMGYNDAGRMRIIRWCHNNHIPCWLFGDSNILGDTAGGLKRVIKDRLVRRVVGWCDGVFSCGRLGAQYFARYGANEQRCFYFPYEPDYDLIHSLTTREVQETARHFSLDPDRRRIVFSGRLVEVKRLDLLLDAFAAIAGQRPDWDLLVIGDGPLRQQLQARLTLELAHRVRWTGFLDHQASVSALYRMCDVLVLPSDFEPWALVINEAVAAGLAIVSSNVVGAAAELVQEGINGRLFPPGDLKALTECLLDVTDAANIDAMRSASANVLAEWRQRGDPVAGLRGALKLCGLITDQEAK